MAELPRLDRPGEDQRRPLFARGHLLDFCYALFYALLVIPLVVLLGAGFSDLLADNAPWLVLPRASGVPGWCSWSRRRGA